MKRTLKPGPPGYASCIQLVILRRRFTQQPVSALNHGSIDRKIAQSTHISTTWPAKCRNRMTRGYLNIDFGAGQAPSNGTQLSWFRIASSLAIFRSQPRPCTELRYPSQPFSPLPYCQNPPACTGSLQLAGNRYLGLSHGCWLWRQHFFPVYDPENRAWPMHWGQERQIGRDTVRSQQKKLLVSPSPWISRCCTGLCLLVCCCKADDQICQAE